MGYDRVGSTRAGAITLSESRAHAFRERTKRGGLLAAIAMIHGLAILWLVTRPDAPPASTTPGISLFDIAAPGGGSPARAPPKPPRPTPDAVPPEVIIPSLLPAPAPDAPPALAALGASATGTGMGGGCALAQAAGQAILADPLAMAELEGLPPEARTEADAVMLWDGVWKDFVVNSGVSPIVPNRPAGAMQGTIRFVIQHVVRLAAPECRNAPVLGPQFIQIPGVNRTTTVVIGSGSWRWDDLIRPDKNCVAADGQPCRSELPAQVTVR